MYNYGNRLQNYAVTTLLQEAGAKAETIVIEKKQWQVYLKKFLLKTNLLPWVVAVLRKERPIRLYCKRRKKFKKFTDAYIPTRYYGPKDIEHLAGQYRYFLIGSDQVWNPDLAANEFDFACFAAQEQKIAIAPSFGTNEIPELHKNRIGEHLKSFFRLSVREQSGAQMIRELTNLEAKVLVDPTMMLKREQWYRMVRQPKSIDTSRPYIFSYFLGGKPPSTQKAIAGFMKKIDAVEYSILDRASKELYTVDPGEFLWLIQHAALVCTDSFHATVFSILFDRPFAVFKRDGAVDMFDRIETLLMTLGLEDRLPDVLQEESVFDHNYTNAYEHLEEKRKEAIQYLKDAMPELEWSV
ncbi:MAG: polysaccharide pyruvyl transferase family protein [Eubacteriales bacterium]|nr:polysaccharide pyruvyl transferase family protein [Eubacteriales bacterium]